MPQPPNPLNSREIRSETTLSIRIPEGLKPELVAQAQASGVTLSEYCRAILVQALMVTPPDQELFQQARRLAIYMFEQSIARIPPTVEEAINDGWFPVEPIDPDDPSSNPYG